MDIVLAVKSLAPVIVENQCVLVLCTTIMTLILLVMPLDVTIKETWTSLSLSRESSVTIKHTSRVPPSVTGTSSLNARLTPVHTREDR